MTMFLKERRFWCAQKPLSVKPVTLPVQYVVCSGTKTHPCDNATYCKIQVQFIQRMNMAYLKSRLSDIKYNFLIGGDGMVYEGRGWNVSPTLPYRYKWYNDRSLFIGFIGRFKDLNEVPPNMQQARDLLIDFGMQKNFISDSILLYSLRCLHESGIHNDF